MSSERPDICVAHLVRHANDLTALREFIDSYRAHPAGAPHDLVIIFKGFRSPADVKAHEALLAGLDWQPFFVDDTGFDIGSYLKTANRFPHMYFCFLNSFSRIEKPDWLGILLRNLQQPGVGIVGATGSWQSISADYRALDAAHPRHNLRFWKRWIIAVDLHFKERFTQRIFDPQIGFPDFPNPHLRTNALLVARTTLLGLHIGGIRDKWDTFRLESGRHSLTARILRSGLRVLVVGADGLGYEPEHWPGSRTFWIHEQENLLVSDNQTRSYSAGNEVQRQRLAHRAWRLFPDGRSGSVFADEWRS